MNIGDYIRIHFDGKGSGGEVIEGMVLHCQQDELAKKRSDNYSRWFHIRLLVDGNVRNTDLYWDDCYEILIRRDADKPGIPSELERG